MHFVKKRLEIIFPKIWIPYCLVNYAPPQAASLPLFRHRRQWPTQPHPCFWQQPSIGIFEIHFDMEDNLFAISINLPAEPNDPLGILVAMGLYHSWRRLPGSQEVIILQTGFSLELFSTFYLNIPNKQDKSQGRQGIGKGG